MIRVKVCGLNEPSNVSAISKAGPDFIGFIFYPGSKRFVGEHPDIMLFRNVSSKIKKTGVFVNEDLQKVLDLALYADLDAIQLHGDESVNYCNFFRKSGFSVIKTFGVGPGFDPEITDRYSDVCDYFLFDTKTEHYGGSGEKFNWSIINNYQFKKPFFISGGIGPEDAGIIGSVLNPQFYGVDVNSRFEVMPGVKDAIKIKKFIYELKNIKYEF